jgi:mannosyltransferase
VSDAAAVGTAPARSPSRSRCKARALPAWWPLAALTLLAAALRLSTLEMQSFWYDEAFTPVRVLHAGLGTTLRSVVHTENTPPLWYLLAWADVRLFGDGEIALRSISAIAGIATVPVAWLIGAELAGRRAAIVTAAIVAVNPLFVWYSQEARAYALFALFAALAMLCFLRALREPSARRMAEFALSGALALLTHYFAVFLLAAMVAWLLAQRRTRRASLPALAVLAAVGAALVPLISAQGGHGTQWIGRWPLGERVEAIPQYFLTGYTGASLGHGVELLIALPILAAVALGAWGLAGRPPSPGQRERLGEARAALVCLVLAGCGVLVPLALALAGADYLAPRNLLAAMVPASALLALLMSVRETRAAGAALAAVSVLGFLILSVDIDLSPRLQRGDWRAVAHLLRRGAGERAITTVELGSLPLEYYLPGLRSLPRGRSVTVREIDETGYLPLRRFAGAPPAPGFVLRERRNLHGLLVYRFLSSTPRTLSESALRRNVITPARPEVLVPAGLPSAHASADAGALARMLPSAKRSRF